MSLRSATFPGSFGNPWPALSTGDAWGAVTATSPGKTSAQYDSIIAVVTGSNYGQIGHNLTSQVAVSALTSAGSTAASSAGRYLLNSTSVSSGIVLLFVCTTWTASHYHQVTAASGTGGWTGSVFNLVTSYEYSQAGIFYKMSIFRTIPVNNSTGNIALDIYDTSTSAIIATQATGINWSTIGVLGVDTASNGVNAVRAANTVTSTSTTGQPTVTLPSSLLRYTSTPMAFFSTAANTTMTSSSSNATVRSSTSHAGPVSGAAVVNRTLPTSQTTVKTQLTMTANFLAATTKWGAIGIELVALSTTDSYIDPYLDYTLFRIVDNTIQPQYQSAEVRSAADVAEFPGVAAGLIGRYVVSGGTKYWIGVHVIESDAKETGTASIYSVVDNGTTTTWTTLASTSTSTVFDTLNNTAIRVRVLASGDLWVSAKFWGTTEPAWPTLSTDPGTAQTINTIYSTVDPLRNAATAQVGLYYTYAYTAYILNGTWVSSQASGSYRSYLGWSNDFWIESSPTLSASISSTVTYVLEVARSIATTAQSVSASLTREVLKTFTSSSNLVSTLSKQILKSLAQVLTASAINTKTLSKTLSSSITPVVTVIKSVAIRFVSALSTTANIVIQYIPSFLYDPAAKVLRLIGRTTLRLTQSTVLRLRQRTHLRLPKE